MLHKNNVCLTFCTAALLSCGFVNSVKADIESTANAPIKITQGEVITDGQDGVIFINQMISSASQLDNYSSKYKMAVYKSRTPQQETGIFYFRKPNLMRVEVFTGPKKGSLAVLEADGKVHGHMGGAMKFFSGAVSPDSGFVRAINEFPMVGTDYLSLAQYLTNKMLDKGDQSRVTKTPIANPRTDKPTFVLDMFGKDGTREQLKKRIYVDPHTKLPVYWEDYRSGKLWSESSWSDVKTNQNLPANTFKI